MKKKKERLIEVKWFTKHLTETIDFRKFKAIHGFGDEIRNNIISMSTANDEHYQLLRYINKFKSRTKPHNSGSKKLKEDVLNSAKHFLKEEKWYIKLLKADYF